MRLKIILTTLAILLFSSCLQVDQEPVLLLGPSADLSAHIKNGKLYATVQLNANPQIITAGNIPMYFEFTGNLSIYNTKTGNIIDLSEFSGKGASKVYVVSADTTAHERFVVIATGSVSSYADIGNDQKTSNDKLLGEADFYEERQFIVSEVLSNSAN